MGRKQCQWRPTTLGQLVSQKELSWRSAWWSGWCHCNDERKKKKQNYLRSVLNSCLNYTQAAADNRAVLGQMTLWVSAPTQQTTHSDNRTQIYAGRLLNVCQASSHRHLAWVRSQSSSQYTWCPQVKKRLKIDNSFENEFNIFKQP